MKIRTLVILAILVFVPRALSAQTATMDDVRLFQAVFRDAAIGAPFGEGLAQFMDRGGSNVLSLGVQGGVGFMRKVEISGGLYFSNIDADGASDSRSGVLDIPVYGRYNFIDEDRTRVSGGTFLTLPVGSDDLGQGNFNFGFFGAVRHALTGDRVTLTANAGVDLVERPGFFLGPICIPWFNPITGLWEYPPGVCVPGPQAEGSRKATFGVGGGAVYAATEQLHLIGEARIETRTDYAALSGGMDYRVSPTGRVRGNLLVGLDDGAPDAGLTVGYLVTF